MTTKAPLPPRASMVDARHALSLARAARQTAEAAEVEVLRAALDWALANPPLLGRDAAAALVSGRPGEKSERLPLSAEGVPEVDRAAVAELGLALGCSTQAAQSLIGDALELAHRLPGLWTRVVAGEVAVWRARRVAQATRPLPAVGAGFVDRQVAALAQRLSGAQLDRLIEVAMTRYDPAAAHRIAEDRREGRRLDVDLDETTLSGLTTVAGRIDLPDALDLEAALAHAAEQLAAWGSDESSDVRRARALGDLAREHLASHGRVTPAMPIGDACLARRGADAVGAERVGASADAAERGSQADASAVGPRWTVPPRRQVVLYLHLSENAIRDESGTSAFGRVENTEMPIAVDTIRDWCGDPGTKLSIRPVLDLAESLHAYSYEVPARLREQIRLRDGTCVFPGCRAKGLTCQDDHIDPYDHQDPGRGGQTETTNLALLCQRHHTLKTHHGFSYTLLRSGAVLWRTPHGLRVRRNPDGTTEVGGLPELASFDPPDP